MKTYQVKRKVAKPTVTSPPVTMTPNRKMSSSSSLSYSRFTLSKEVKPQPEIQVIEDPANLDKPQPQPDV